MMSILIFIDEFHEIVLAKIMNNPKRLLEVGRWSAHNNVAKKSRGEWPPGFYPYSHYNAHAEAGLLPASAKTAYGGTGIHVFIVPGRSGMGVHAGREIDYSKLGGVTLGCIRVPADAMLEINRVHAGDRLTHIYVAKKSSIEALSR
jgi:hypothetical protein